MREMGMGTTPRKVLKAALVAAQLALVTVTAVEAKASAQALTPVTAGAAAAPAIITSAGAYSTPAKRAPAAKTETWAHGGVSKIDRYHDYLNKFSSRSVERGAFSGSIENEYIQFATQEEAFEWYRQFSVLYSRVTGEPQTSVVLPTDPKYAKAYQRLNAGVDRLWTSYQVLFPEQVAGLAKPFVILNSDADVNAFVARDFNSDRIVHAINVNAGIMDLPNASDDEIFGVIGHELAHSVFRHILPKYQEYVVKYYDRSKFKGQFSYEASNEPMVSETAKAWISHAESAGDLTYAELGDLPSISKKAPDYFKVLAFVAQKGPGCDAMVPSLEEILKASVVDPLSNDISIAPASLPRVKQLASDVTATLERCTEGQKIPLLKVMSSLYKMPEDKIADKIPKEDTDAFDGQPSIGKAILAATRMHREQMIALNQRMPVSAIGAYTFEEHADDVSAIVLAHSGLSASKFGDFFLQFLGDQDTLAKCNAAMGSGKEPPIGTLMDPHRASCYRADHLRKLVQGNEFKQDISGFAKKFLGSTWNSEKFH